MARPGTERPLSMKLTCRCVVPARNASSSWLTRRRPRHSRRAAASPPTWLGGLARPNGAAGRGRAGFSSFVLRARGHEELEARVTRTYHEFIASGDYTFRSRDNADRLGDVVKFNWEMIPAGGGEVAGAGLEILVLDTDGRITADYQFIEG